ncbi:hypothetical protein [Echinicola sp. 20G]|uniref:hypothetical protein n=1 Tax=Echinicola sp. 20G TaxID=2781961 RepID=UPI001910A88D|nr:hypothetical protein [Echinicola sp. 20G]
MVEHIKKGIIKNYSENLNGDLYMNFYALDEHWRSDLAFYQDELRFLRDLLGKYFHRFIEDIDMNYVRRIENRLSILDRRREEIDFKVDRQMSAISHYMRENTTGADRKVVSHQEELEELLCVFAKDFRNLKKRIFKLVEDGLNQFQSISEDD